MKRLLALFVALLLLPGLTAVVAEEDISLFSGGDISAPTDTVIPTEALPDPTEAPVASTVAKADTSARGDFIDRMLALAETLYQKAAGRAQPASSPGHIYVCKNFTVHLFRENRADFRIAEYPEVPLRIPNNLPAKASKPYSYGIAWEDIPAQEGNPFYAAHSFYYNTELSKAENRELALAFMRQVQRGDFFQMSANYYYGVGAHSAVFTRDYDALSDSVYWTDSNMKGETRNGSRYGYVQYDAQKPISWFVDAFCQKGRGATLYRLRDDIIKP